MNSLSAVFGRSLIASQKINVRRPLYSAYRYHGDEKLDPNAKDVTFYFTNKQGNKVKVIGKTGQNVLRVAQKYDIGLEGACECSLACSTCHVILDQKIYDSLPDPSEKEDDLLDLAYGLTMTSRLGCQVKLTEEMENMNVIVPKASRNFYVDGEHLFCFVVLVHHILIIAYYRSCSKAPLMMIWIPIIMRECSFSLSVRMCVIGTYSVIFLYFLFFFICNGIFSY